MTESSIPSRIRPLAFAGGELLLDMLYLAQRHYKLDLESVLIMVCVNDATMRPFMTDTSFDQSLLTQRDIPDNFRGTISRLKVADKTGLSRETVRRKCKQLLQLGLLIEPEEGHLRTTNYLDDPGVHKTLDESHKAVQGYLKRLETFGVGI